MKLEDWRLKMGVSYARLGLDIGVSEETARRFCLPEGHALSRFPDRAMLRKIEALTGGQVTATDFVNP
jgi:hypothetical protein